MPFAKKPNCSSCQATKSNLWRKGPQGKTFCIVCARKELDGVDDSQGSEGSSKNDLKDFTYLTGPAVRKSSRIKPSKYKYQPLLKPLATKGKSRRVVFKKNPIKAPAAVATTVTSDYIFHDGQYWQVGDIASVMDDDGGIYYVQLRGFLQDQYCERSAVITWLLPTTASIPGKFDPATYIIGPEEDLPRSMACFEFVMHAPSDYFYDKSSPYRTEPRLPELGCIFTHLGPEIRRIPPPDQIYCLQELDSDDTETSHDNAAPRHDGDKRKKRELKERKRGRIAKAKKLLPKVVPKVIPKVVPIMDLDIEIKEEPVEAAPIVRKVRGRKRRIVDESS